jgi:hypothetical protein
MSDFATNREKLDKISNLVNEMFSAPGLSSQLYGRLMLIDSICDEPLFVAEDESKAWNE